ncbi:MAG: hypothetical protein JRM99_05950, partial [Nitrososphaerota archaeon]|nr:hypothetical protein [Nitrososphaerota archaeon]
LTATDQSGSPLSYGFAPGGNNITVYTLGASAVTLGYDTSSLTSKNGSIWTLTFAAASNSTVALPPLSTLSSVSGVPFDAPYSINLTGTSPEVTLPEGSWKIGYGVPFPGLTLTGAGSTSQSGTPGVNGPELEVAVVVVAAAVAAVFFLARRRRQMPKKGDLRQDDLQVLTFIREKGGKVLEPEIRVKFALPKTSAWRQIKRLERMGYVKVTKAGSQNQIELVKDKGANG